MCSRNDPPAHPYRLYFRAAAGYTLALFPNLILSIYTDIPDLREASIPSLWVLCSAYLILVPANVYFQAVSGTGNTRTALGLELCVLAIYLIYITYMILYLRVDVAVCWTTETSVRNLYPVPFIPLYKERKLAEKADLT